MRPAFRIFQIIKTRDLLFDIVAAINAGDFAPAAAEMLGDNFLFAKCPLSSLWSSRMAAPGPFDWCR